MKITIEILNERFEEVETMRPVYTGTCVLTDYKGQHTVTECLEMFIRTCSAIASESIMNLQDHTAILYQDGIPVEIWQHEED